MQATKAEYSNYFSVPWKIQPLSQEQKKNPAEEFFTSSTNPQKHLQTIYIPKIPVLALGWCFVSSLLQHLDDPKFLGFSPKKTSLTGVREEIPHLWQTILEDEDEQHFQVIWV